MKSFTFLAPSILLLSLAMVPLTMSETPNCVIMKYYENCPKTDDCYMRAHWDNQKVLCCHKPKANLCRPFAYADDELRHYMALGYRKAVFENKPYFIPWEEPYANGLKDPYPKRELPWHNWIKPYGIKRPSEPKSHAYSAFKESDTISILTGPEMHSKANSVESSNKDKSHRRHQSMRSSTSSGRY
ncbi:hypothetical protein BJ684DRAFT_15517 [Piptocephalis cylindrospora]|uniref:Uncharacterized protein n=1 Tax=Piptocephalis cylindrospora TaxID=1907219 RepID=A0A4P9Y552_9FUNG|nr:hypothetical protein BJ684DRAFT_15517 [Piptocephalis cylindrospora]|eukprot:RKP14138.1 hypothetical protein BJ684DRAFT_15517 [Piptocephalis cylindrospora]